MTAQEAAKRIQKLLGPKGAWRTNPKALTAENKPTTAEIREAIHAHKAARDAAEARLLQLKLNDPEFVRLRAEQQQARIDMEKVQSDALRYRVTVGTSDGMFFHVKAQGDNWAEVIRELEAKAAEARR